MKLCFKKKKTPPVMTTGKPAFYQDEHTVEANYRHLVTSG